MKEKKKQEIMDNYKKELEKQIEDNKVKRIEDIKNEYVL